MAVAFDAQGTADATSNGATAQNFTALTITGGLSNSALVAEASFSNKGLTNLIVKWDTVTPQTMSAIITANSLGTVARADLYGLIAPASGNKTLRASWTGASDICLDAISYSGVDQTGGATSFAHATSATAAVPGPNAGTVTVTITSAVGNATVAGMCENGGINAQTQTLVYSDQNPTNISAGCTRAAGAATVSHNWTVQIGVGNTINAVLVGCDIVAAAAAGGAAVTATVGISNWAGVAAAVAISTDFTATTGTSNWQGQSAAIGISTNVGATTGVSNWQGQSAAISISTDFTAGVGSSNWAGQSAAVAISTDFTATTGTSNWQGNTAAIAISTDIAAGVGASNWAGVSSAITISGLLDIPATVGISNWQGAVATIIAPSGAAAVPIAKVYRYGNARRIRGG